MAFIALGIAVVLVLIDQLLKMVIVNTVKIDGGFSFLGDFVNIIYVENKGVAFGLMENFRWLFVIVTGVIIFFLIAYLIKYKPKSKMLIISIGMIVGGGIGNLIDRIFLGYVVDYIQLAIFPPVCNFADYCVTIGVALLAVYIVFRSDFFSDDKDKNKKKLADKNG
ncbi:MAG TPA: signal peptidase II [Clostridiales bacterium]|nr:signal peptidase II [Clostridiales bacterium]